MRRLRSRSCASWPGDGSATPSSSFSNVFHVAERYGAKRIQFPGPHPFFRGDRAGNAHLAWAPPVTPSPELAHLLPPRPGLMGNFFNISGLGLRLRPDEQAAIVRRLLRPLVVPDLTRPVADMGDDSLVLHFRAGDVFPGPGLRPGHPDYGQPPLAYYLAAVAREGARRVCLVFEDRGNPTVEAAEAALRRRGIQVRMQSADLAADLNALMNARCLVASAGTFALSAAALSTRIRKVYSFGHSLQYFSDLGVDTATAFDRDGRYSRALMSHNWRAEPEQIQLMLSYPEEAIGFVDNPAVGPTSG